MQYAKDNSVSLLVSPKAGFVYKVERPLHESTVDVSTSSSAATSTSSKDIVINTELIALLNTSHSTAAQRRQSMKTTPAELHPRIRGLDADNDADEQSGILKPNTKFFSKARPMSMRSDVRRESVGAALSSSVGEPLLESTTVVVSTTHLQKESSSSSLRAAAAAKLAATTSSSSNASLSSSSLTSATTMTATTAAAASDVSVDGQLLANVRQQITRTRSMTADNVFQVFNLCFRFSFFYFTEI